jgi:hypothetical protein
MRGASSLLPRPAIRHSDGRTAGCRPETEADVGDADAPASSSPELGWLVG